MKGFNWKWKEINWKWKDLIENVKKLIENGRILIENGRILIEKWGARSRAQQPANRQNAKCMIMFYKIENNPKRVCDGKPEQHGSSQRQPAAASSSQRRAANRQKCEWVVFLPQTKKRSYRHGPDSLKQGRKNRNCKSRRRQESMIFQKWKSTKKCFYRKKRQQQQSSQIGGSSFPHGEIEVMFQKHCKTQWKTQSSRSRELNDNIYIYIYRNNNIQQVLCILLCAYTGGRSPPLLLRNKI